MIKNYLYHRLLASLVIVSILMTPFLPSTVAHAQTTSGSASIDCAEVTALGDVILAGITTYMTGASTAIGINTLVVPIQDKPSELTSANTGAVTTGETLWDTTLSGFLDCVVYKAGQIALENLTNQTINWIKSGMNGSPYYAIDTHKFETDLIDAVAGNFSRQIQGLELCDFDPSFKEELANRLLVVNTGDSDLKFRTTVACPFKLISASEFYQGTQAFTWQYFETALNDSGNPFGVSLATQNKYSEDQAKETTRAKQQLDWGQGFLSVIDPDDCPNMPAAVKEWMEAGGPTATPEAIAAYQRAYCKTTTPSKLIESQLTKATDTDWERLGLADSLSKIISALIGKASEEARKGILKL